MARRRSFDGKGVFATPASAKTPKSRFFLKKTEENRKKPVETGLFPLTNALRRRKVNGGNFFRTRVNTGFSAMRRDPEADGDRHSLAFS
ncbi:MAG: hypothetical protein WCA44_00260 [Acidobacteriaceae bacterium]